MTENKKWPIRFYTAMDSIYIACNYCKHRYADGISCKAFPKRIPKELMLRGEHTTPYPGDNGIRFEPIEKDVGF